MMRDFAEDVLDALLERQVHEFIGALFVGFALSLCLYGFYRLVRGKVSDEMALMMSLFLLANVASASMVIGYLRYHSRREAIPVSPSSHAQPSLDSAIEVGRLYVRMADENRDGVISPEELSRMTARTDENRDGLISPEEMCRMFACTLQPAPTPGVESGSPGVHPADRQSGPGLQ